MCIKCGYYFKNYDHSGDLSDNLTSSVLGTNQALANYLSIGFWENYGTVSRKFNLSENGLNPKNGTITYNTNGNSFDDNGISSERAFMVDEAFKLLEATMGFNFQETDFQADINFGDEYRNSAFAYVDGRSYSSGLDFVNINIGSNWNSSKSNFGDYTFQTILHEIGHSLGLGHQGLYNGSANYSQNALFQNDSWQSSIMSYFSQIENTSINSSFAYLSTYMSADWIALDDIYSAEGFSTANAFRGDTTFGFNTNISSSTSFIYSEMSNLIGQTAFTLVDGSGIDTVDFSEFSTEQLIDLRVNEIDSKTLYTSNIGGKIGNLTIASGTIIENAEGGKGSDLIYGNSAGNKIFGNDGDDDIYGESGKDKLFGGDGADYSEGGRGRDNLYGGGGNDYLVGGRGRDNLHGGGGNDYLVGGRGRDNLYGGRGNDVFKLSIGRGFDRIRDFKKGEDRVDIAEFDINQLGVYESGKNLKVYLDQGKSDLLAILHNQNLNEGSISDFIF
jgi:Ca2+-binding RTX toxin-like protein